MVVVSSDDVDINIDVVDVVDVFVVIINDVDVIVNVVDVVVDVVVVNTVDDDDVVDVFRRCFEEFQNNQDENFN